MQLQNLRTCWSRQQVEMDSSLKFEVEKPRICGGLTESTDATEDIQELCNKVRKEVEAKTNQKYAEFKAVKYRSAVAAGSVTLVKIRVKDGQYIHVEVFQALPCNGGKLEVIKVAENHKKADPLVSF